MPADLPKEADSSFYPGAISGGSLSDIWLVDEGAE
jgi:hypothetical protein